MTPTHDTVLTEDVLFGDRRNRRRAEGTTRSDRGAGSGDRASPVVGRETDRLYASMCADPSFDEVVCALFEFEPHLQRTYAGLHAHDRCTTEELAAVLGRDRSSVSRALSWLRSKGLASRRRDVRVAGGQVYYHTATDPGAIEAAMARALDEWTARAHERLEAFDARVVTEDV